MVDNNKQGGMYQVEVTQPQEGMHTDTSPHSQPPGTYRFALNGINESKDGNLGFITNEEGNQSCFTIPTIGGVSYTVIGSVYLNDDDIIVFLAPTEIPAGLPTSWVSGIIGKVSNKCDYANIITSSCLNFDIKYPIEAIHRVRNGCENVVYFTDNKNPIREINLDSLDQYLLEDRAYSPDDPRIWDCDQFKLIPNYQVPVVNFVQIHDTGGFKMLLGTYQVALRYLDADLNPTNWCTITNPVPISADEYGSLGLNEPATKISGGFNDDDHDSTTKSISYEISNIDPSFEYLDIAMIRTVSGNGAPSDAYILDTLPIDGATNLEYTLRGQISASTPVPLNDIVIPRVPYDTAKTIAQIDQRLVLGNITSPYIDHEAFQRSANTIAVTYHTKAQAADLANNTAVDVSAASGKNYFDRRTYMRDEVYALGIIWILKDGTESPVYHIPGRLKNRTALDTLMPTSGDPNNPGQANYSVTNDPDGFTETHREALPNGGLNAWDTHQYSTDYASPGEYAATYYTGNAGYNGLHLDNVTDPERWQIYNTALRERVDFTPGGGGDQSFNSSGQMGYWEAKDYEYPPTLGCDGTPVYPHTIVGRDFVMDKIRHHKMPDTTLEPHFYSPDFRYPINDNVAADPTDCTGCDPVIPCVESLSNAAQHYAALGKQLISHLGIDVNNIVCPLSMRDSVQAFKIVKAHRTDENKSVVDKGLMYKNFMTASVPNQSPDHDPDDNDCFTCDKCSQFVQTPTFNRYQIQKGNVNGSEQVGERTANTAGKGITPVGTKGWNAHAGASPTIGDSPFRVPPGCVDLDSYIGYNTKTSGTAPSISSDPPEAGRAHCMFCDSVDLGSAQCKCIPGVFAAGLDASDCWQCDDPSCVVTSGSYTNIGCSPNGMPDGVTQEEIVDKHIKIYNWENYDNFGNFSFHGFKSKVDGADGKNQLFDHIKFEKIIYGKENVSLGEDEDTTGAIGTTQNDNPAYDSGIVHYNHYGTPPHRIDAAQFQNIAPLNPSVLPYVGIHQVQGIARFFEGTNFPLYNYPVSNSGGFVEADTGVIEGLTKYDFRNTRQQETYVAEAYTRTDFSSVALTPAEQEQNICGIPEVFANWDGQDYPSGNGFKRTPCDSSVWMDKSEGEELRTSTAYYVGLKRTNDNQYGPIDDIIYIETDAEIYEGDFAETLNIKIFGGDSFIDKFVFRKTFYGGSCFDGGTVNHAAHYYKSTRGVAHYVECDYNPTFRDAPDNDECKRYAYYGPHTFGIEKGHGYGDQGGDWLRGYENVEPFVGNWNSDSKTKTPARSDCLEICHNYYSYNPDFSAQNVLKKYFSLDQAYKYAGTLTGDTTVDCNTCYFNFDTRIAYSEKSFQEERADHFKKFLANNYKDVPSETGSITKVFTQGNKLYANTEEASWVLQTSSQQLKTDTTVLYVGTGDFLSIPPQKLGDTMVGFAGSVSQWAGLKTELGTFIVDERAQRIYLLGGEKGLNPIYAAGMRNWFETNMRFNLIAQLDSLGYTFPFPDSPHAYAGIGYHAVYDTRHSRYILTKRDYEFNALGLSLVKNWVDGAPGVDKIQLNTKDFEFYWEYIPVVGLPIKLGLPELTTKYMVDKSWTISYSGLNNKWVSFHSYRPTSYITGKNSFYSIWKYDDSAIETNIWIHNTIPYHTYYELEFPHVLELVNVKNPLQTMIYDNYHFLAETSEYNTTQFQNIDIRETTFNKVILYNEYQCTNVLNFTNKNRNPSLMPQNSVINRAGDITISRDERSWAFDGFRDLLQNRTVPIFSKAETDKLADPLFSAPPGGYIDKVINPIAFIDPNTLDPALTLLQQQRFRDKYLAIRLFFGNFGEVGVDVQNYKLTTNYIFPTTSVSPR